VKAIQYSPRRESGQATSEFLVAMLVIIPLFLGVVYIGKYEDVRHSAIQASRYSAFERVYDPWKAHKSDAVLAEETRARFFTDPMLSNKGAVGYQDTTQNLSGTNGTTNQNWYGTGGQPILSQYSGSNNAGVTVQMQTGSVSGAAYAGLQLLDTLSFKAPDPGMAQAHVKVGLANVTSFAPLSNLNLVLDESTSVLTDGYNASGAGNRSSPADNSVRSRVYNEWGPATIAKFANLAGPMRELFSVIDSGVASWGWQFLTDTNGPQWGCISPDVVPSTAAPGATYDPKNASTNC